MSTFSYDGPMYLYLAWQAGAFVFAFFANSFIEHFVHKYIMHARFPFISYGYLHTTSHHAKFGADESFHAREEWLKDHILFTWKEYVLLPLLCLAAYVPVELLIGRPILIGVVLAALAGIQLFNSLHWSMHVPSDTWFQRTLGFQFLKNHHRIHHADMTCNFNVHFLPIGDWVFRTLRLEMPKIDPQKKTNA